ncbi:hypothetical protein ABZ897_15755 [Nonomuraea sp. NPDC046802]|uniref:hypothetical protein n=1 Tax=Nonomuraea sp. NPDC046802 TaxID=3154919 RepID=UPI003406285B
MATLLAVIRPGGRTQRCDARCYDAHEAECECVCGGLNHGAGLHLARENTRRLHQEWLEAAHAADPEILGVEVDLDAQGYVLF